MVFGMDVQLAVCREFIFNPVTPIFKWQKILTMVNFKDEVTSSICSYSKAAAAFQRHTSLACDGLQDQQTWEPLRLFITQW